MKKYTSIQNKRSVQMILSIFACLTLIMALTACDNSAETARQASAETGFSQEEEKTESMNNDDETQETPSSDDAVQENTSGIGDEIKEADDIISLQMKELVQESPNYKNKLQQDESGNWIYHVGDAEIHLRTNFWDYIEFSPRSDEQEDYVSGGMTYKVDIGKLAESLGWTCDNPEYYPSKIHYPDSPLQPRLLTSYQSSNNRFGLDSVEIYLTNSVIEDNSSDAVFSVVYFGSVRSCYAMTYDMLIASVCQLERIADYCDMNGAQDVNDYAFAKLTNEWYISTFLPEIEHYASGVAYTIYLPKEE